MGLADHPRAYPLLPNQGERGVRRAPHGRWAICYSVDDNGVLVIRILDSAQDATDLF
jgi:toxin ParE1/3/4